MQNAHSRLLRATLELGFLSLVTLSSISAQAHSTTITDSFSAEARAPQIIEIPKCERLLSTFPSQHLMSVKEMNQKAVLDETAKKLLGQFDFPKSGNIPKEDKLLRQALLKAFKNRCYYSGDCLEMKTLTVDHVIPHAQGGPDNVYNYVPAGARINSEKSNKVDYDAALGLLSIIRFHYAPLVLEEYRHLLVGLFQPPNGRVNDRTLRVKTLSAFQQFVAAEIGRYSSRVNSSNLSVDVIDIQNDWGLVQVYMRFAKYALGFLDPIEDPFHSPNLHFQLSENKHNIDMTLVATEWTSNEWTLLKQHLASNGPRFIARVKNLKPQLNSSEVTVLSDRPVTLGEMRLIDGTPHEPERIVVTLNPILLMWLKKVPKENFLEMLNNGFLPVFTY